MAAATLVTVGIPLFRSERFVDNVLANIRAMPATGVEIIVSDRHLADSALERIAAATDGDPRVRCIAATDELDWVAHINLLMSMASGTYWRLLPHDDLVPPGALECLLAAMESDPALLVAYASTRAEDLSGNHLPSLDVTTAIPDTSAGWTYGCFLDLYRRGHFRGAFKGLVRMEPIRRHQLYIRPNTDLIDSERLWLFGLALLGRFRFVPESVYIKRYYEDSTHRQWRRRSVHALGTLRIMRSYLRDLHPRGTERRLSQTYLALNTLAALRAIRGHSAMPFPWPLDSPRLVCVPLVGSRCRKLSGKLLALRDQAYTCEADRPVSGEPDVRSHGTRPPRRRRYGGG